MKLFTKKGITDQEIHDITKACIYSGVRDILPFIGEINEDQLARIMFSVVSVGLGNVAGTLKERGLLKVEMDFFFKSLAKTGKENGFDKAGEYIVSLAEEEIKKHNTLNDIKQMVSRKVDEMYTRETMPTKEKAEISYGRPLVKESTIKSWKEEKLRNYIKHVYSVDEFNKLPDTAINALGDMDRFELRKYIIDRGLFKA